MIKNKFNRLFLKSNLNCPTHSPHKITWKNCVRNIALGMAVTTLLIGFFMRSSLDYFIGVLILGIFAVMGAWGESKE